MSMKLKTATRGCVRHVLRQVLSLLTILVWLPKEVCAANLDSLLVILDSCIEQREVYEQQFLQKEDSLWAEAERESDLKKALKLWSQIADNEFRYKSDRAITVLNKAYDIARQLEDKQSEYRFLMRKAEVYGMLGIPWEAEFILEPLLVQGDLSKHWRKEAFSAYYNSYEVFRHNSLPREITDRKLDEIRAIEDTLKGMDLTPVKAAFTLERSSSNVPYMISVLLKNMENSPGISNAVTAMVLADKYSLMGDDRGRDYYWALSAIYCLRHAQYEVSSLAKLSKRLLELGDTDRAIRYMFAAYENADIYGANQYKADIASILQTALKLKVDETDWVRRKTVIWMWGAFFAGILLLCALLGYWLNYKKLYKLRVELETEREQEQHYIETLKTHVELKDEYVSRFLELSLDAVYEVEQLRRITLMRMKNGEYDRLKKTLTDSTRFEAFQKECLLRFDLAFLRLYPEFTRQINKLLLPGEQIDLPDTQLLNNELRILAFMKLGVTDGSKIATILGISVNTLYFYRNRFRRKAIDRGTFEASIMAL